MIQWFPGHMYKASKEFRKILPQVDLVIEVLDARLPGSSENPMLAKLSANVPGIKLLNKSDLANSDQLQDWCDVLQTESRRALPCHTGDSVTSVLPGLCRELVPLRENRSKMIYAMIAGIPNVGKSTLINRLAGRVIAKTGNEAALTRMQQRIEISPELTLIDTPGMLWPKIVNPASGYRLAASGAIRDTALDLQDVAAFLAEFLLEHFPQRLIQRYDMSAIPDSEIDALETIARRRGCIVSGGHVDFEKVSRLLINEFREGELGPMCLESPEMFTTEMEAAVLQQQLKAEAKAARKANRKYKSRGKKS
ncbi:MAG: ribosome biogenesis GTPase YlqF [Pseudomonadota bacterium]